MAASKKTLRKRKMYKDAEERSTSAWNGTLKVLQLLKRTIPVIMTDSFAVTSLQRTH